MAHYHYHLSQPNFSLTSLQFNESSFLSQPTIIIFMMIGKQRVMIIFNNDKHKKIITTAISINENDQSKQSHLTIHLKQMIILKLVSGI